MCAEWVPERSKRCPHCGFPLASLRVKTVATVGAKTTAQIKASRRTLLRPKLWKRERLLANVAAELVSPPSDSSDIVTGTPVLLATTNRRILAVPYAQGDPYRPVEAPARWFEYGGFRGMWALQRKVLLPSAFFLFMSQEDRAQSPDSFDPPVRSREELLDYLMRHDPDGTRQFIEPLFDNEPRGDFVEMYAVPVWSPDADRLYGQALNRNTRANS
jgi:hypothetical protein